MIPLIESFSLSMQHKRAWWLVGLLCLVVGGTAVFLTNTTPTNPDSLGYLTAGRQLAAGESVFFSLEQNQTFGPFFYPHAYRLVTWSAAEVTFGYSIGYPALLGLAVWLTGQAGAAHYVVPLLLPLLLGLTAVLAARLTDQGLVAFWAALFLCATPLFWQFGTEPWSEVPTSVMLVGGTLAFVESWRRERTAAARAALAGLAGWLIGFSFFMRLTNMLLLAPTLLLYELWEGKTAVWRETTRYPFYLTVLLSLLGVLTYNQQVLGGALHNIYSTPSLGAYPFPLFDLSYALNASPINGFSLWAIGETIWQNFYGLLLLLPLGIWRLEPKARLVLLGVPLTGVGLYGVYAFAATGVNGRFLLPLFPFLAIILAAGWQAVWAWLARWRTVQVGSGVLLTLGLLLLLWPSLTAMQARRAAEQADIERLAALVAPFPETAVWLSTAYNDILLLYLGRPALNHRRLLTADEGSNQFNEARMQACLVSGVDRVLAAETAVYFLPDRPQQLEQLVADYYELTELSPGLYQLVEPKRSPARDLLASCPI